MTISPHQIHNVLRTYGKQLRRGDRLARTRPPEAAPPEEKLKVSPEAKRQQVVEKVAAEIIFRLAAQSETNDGVEKEALKALSREYGQPLRMTYDRVGRNFSFHVVDPDQGEIVKNLDRDESERLYKRLVEMTRQMVDRTMLKGARYEGE